MGTQYITLELCPTLQIRQITTVGLSHWTLTFVYNTTGNLIDNLNHQSWMRECRRGKGKMQDNRETGSGGNK